MVSCVLTICLFLVVNVLTVYGHMCMIYPYQRGGQVSDINVIEAPECDNSNYNQSLMAPCYKENNAAETVPQYIDGHDSKQVMIQQKNHDHYNASNPGNFTWNLYSYQLSTKRYYFVRTLGSVPDTDTNGSQALYQLIVQVGHLTKASDFQYVIQGVYYTNNYYNGIQYNFYQCADVTPA